MCIRDRDDIMNFMSRRFDSSDTKLDKLSDVNELKEQNKKFDSKFDEQSKNFEEVNVKLNELKIDINDVKNKFESNFNELERNIEKMGVWKINTGECNKNKNSEETINNKVGGNYSNESNIEVKSENNNDIIKNVVLESKTVNIESDNEDFVEVVFSNDV